MNNVKTHLPVKLDRFLVGYSQPHLVMNRENQVAPAQPGIVQHFGKADPPSIQAGVWVRCEKLFDALAVVWMRQNPNPMVARELPGPVPCIAGLATHPRATGETYDQYVHLWPFGPGLKATVRLG